MKLFAAVRSLAAAALVAAAGIAAAPSAEAQVTLPRPLAEYKTEGGRVAYNYRMQVYRGGFTVAVMTRPGNPADALLLYDYLRPADLASLKGYLDRAQFLKQPPVVRTQAVIRDIPDRIASYLGRTVRFTTRGGPRDPIAGYHIMAAMDALAANFARIADEPLVRFDQSGGIAGRRDSLKITRSGLASYTHDRPMPAQPYEQALDFGTVNDLKRKIAAARWATLPDFFPAPFVADAFTYHVTAYDILDRSKTVSGKTGAREPRAYLAVVEACRAIMASLRP